MEEKKGIGKYTRATAKGKGYEGGDGKKKLEEFRRGKEVTFGKTVSKRIETVDEEDAWKRMKGEIKEELIKVKKERIELEEIRERLVEKEEAWEVRLGEIEARLSVWEKEKEEWRYGTDEDRESVASSGRNSMYSRATSKTGGGSVGSAGSLSEREVAKLKRVAEKLEKEEKKCNICLKGWDEREEMNKEILEKWIEEKLGVKCNMDWVRKSGRVIIAKVESWEKKEEIMGKKNVLRGSKYFIDKDRTWEERVEQQRYIRRAFELRAEGKDVRVRWGGLVVKEKRKEDVTGGGNGTGEDKRGEEEDTRRENRAREEEREENFE